MLDFFRKNKVYIITALILICLATSYYLYRESRTHLLNKSEMSSLAKDIKNRSDDGYFTGQDVLTDYITTWADDNGIEYKKDKAGNIVITSKAAARKKKLSPTIVCVSYNYETAGRNARLIASAAMIARAELHSGRKTVIFVNDENNDGSGYRYLNNKLLRGKPKVIYMDYGKTSYLSGSSFGRTDSAITVKAGRFKPECDTAVKVHISGIKSSSISPESTEVPDPVNELSVLLTRLKSRSAICQLADFEVGTDGGTLPVSLDATIMMNSYAVSSFTKYTDKRIKAWKRSYGGNHEDLIYEYEVISDPDQMPEKSYSRSATARLTNVLYTLKYGKYEYGADDVIPEGRKEGDIYGINAATGLRAEDGAICIDLMTQAYDDECMQKIMDDNTAAAELFDCTIRNTYSVPVFINDKDSLFRTFSQTYSKVNNIIGTGSVLETDTDCFFTPCSYLAGKNSSADIIHLRLNAEQAQALTNTILCYIAFKGNFLL